MTGTDSRRLFPQLSEFISARMGLCFPPARWPDLERGIASAAREFQIEDPEELVHRLLNAPLTKAQIEILASHLTIGETYFFREPRTFELLETRILPELIDSRQRTGQRLRIWSAGCATGEEPYSVAILLHKLLPDWERRNLAILATDINPGFLEKAAAGMYRNWSFRSTPSWVMSGYFGRTDTGDFQVAPSVQQMVAFAYLNLAEDAYPSLLNHTNAMDLILCRNVLMYFAPARAAAVVRNLFHALADGGWLIVSPSETSQVLFSDFRTINFPGATFYQKASPKAASPMTSYGECDQSHSVLEERLDACEPEIQAVLPSEPSEMLPVAVQELKPVAARTVSYEDGAALYGQGCYREAAEMLAAYLSKSQGNSTAMELLARTYANLGQLAKALEWCDQAIAADKLNAGCHYLRAIILLEQGAIAEARLSLQNALYLDPEFALAHFALGNLFRREGKARHSDKHFANALAILETHDENEALPASEGLTAGRLAEIIRSASPKGILP